MGLPDDKLELLRKHLNRVRRGRPLICPVCDGREWTAAGVYAAMEFDKDGGGFVVGSGLPVVALVCRNCSFVHQFAWLPIERESNGG